MTKYLELKAVDDGFVLSKMVALTAENDVGAFVPTDSIIAHVTKDLRSRLLTVVEVVVLAVAADATKYIGFKAVSGSFVLSRDLLSL